MNMNMQVDRTLAPATFTATELRKTLFQHLDRAVQGEPVRFTYKGAQLQITLQPGTVTGSKMSRLVYREGLADDDLDRPDPELMRTLEAKWMAEFPDPMTDGEEGGD
jgi:hypothetical protein